MSSLSVENRILRYKGISYQISQITSMKVVEIKIKNKNTVVSLKSLKLLLPTILLSFVSGYYLNNPDYSAMLFIIGVVAALASFYVMKRKWKSIRKDKYRMLYGLSLRLSNGDDPIYTTTNKDLIFKIRNAIDNSMNKDGESVSVSFDNVNIDITDSENVEIGNVIKG